MISWDIQGAAAMENVLRQLGPNLAQRVGDKALLAGAKPIIAEAKRLVVKKTGKLGRSITAKAMVRAGRVDERVVYIGFKKPVSRIAHLIEFGTAHSAAQPFMRPAMSSKAGEALTEMGRVLAVGIDTEAAKLAKV